MAEETHNNYRQLESNPNRKNLDPAVSERNSAENTELFSMADRLKNPQDEIEYFKDLNTLQVAAENGWPVAQIGLANYFRDVGAFQEAQKYSDRLSNNQWVGKSLESDVDRLSKTKDQEQRPEPVDVNAVAVYLKRNKDQKDATYTEVKENLANMANAGNEFAQLEYGRLLRSENKPDEAKMYFQKVVNNKEADPQVRREASQELGQQEKKEENALEKGLRQVLSRNRHDSPSEAKFVAYKQAAAIVASQKRDEGYLPHHSFIPPKDED